MPKGQPRTSNARRAASSLLAGFIALQGLPLAASPASDPKKTLGQPVAATSKEEKATLAKAPAAAVRDDRILLNVGAIDTGTPEAAALRTAAGSFEGRRLHLVQFQGAIQPEWYKELEATGAEVVQYIPSNSYLVYGDAAALRRVQALASAAARWDGPYLDRYKIQAGAQAPVRERLGLPDRDLFSVQLVRDPEANAATLKLIAARAYEPLKSRWEILKYVDLVATLPAAAVAEIAARPDVVMIDRKVVPTKNDERQDLIVAGQLSGNGPAIGNYLTYLAGKGLTQAQFTTSNFVVDVTDSGIDNGTTAPNHLGLHLGGNLASAGRVQYNRLEGTPNAGSTIQGCDGHGNLNSHIVAGYVDTSLVGVPANHADASGFRYGLGVAPFVKVGSSVIFDPANFTFPSYPNLQSRAYNDNARISTNSWGANVGGAYNTDSQAYDALVRDAQPAGSAFPTAGNQEMVIVFSAGNSGAGANTIGSPGTAKNVITVGASEGVQAFGGADGCGIGDVNADSANDVIFFSSRGPTDDGRVKPDIVAPGTHISGGVFQAAASAAGTGAAGACFDGTGVCGGLNPSAFFPAGQQFYAASSGTSHSAPAVSGGAALVRQHFINSGLIAPSPAMTKAVLANGARYMNGVGANDTLPSNAQGRGMMNLDALFSQIAGPRILHDQVPADMFTASGQSRTITGTVASAAQPFRVTLAFTDTPGPTTGNAFVNDLDLEVTVGGNTYRGNVFAGANSTTGGAADPRNNLESVFLPAGVTGAFSVRVLATNIAGDGVPNVGGALDQDYALVISNATQTFAPVISAGTASIVTEGCTPNGALDPGETVTLSFCLQNTGAADTTNAVATLQATGGVASPSGPQSYGALTAGGAAVCHNFTFTVGALACGASVTPTLQVQDGATDLGNISWIFTTGLPAVNFGENFDGVVAPALPAGWTNVVGSGAGAWATVNTTVDTAPNAAFINDPAGVTDVSLVTPNIAMPAAATAAVLTFRNYYQLEGSATAGFDGGVLEISIAGGAFQDVISAGGVFQSGGYNRAMSTGFGSPIGGRQAWSADSGGYVTTSVTLPASVAGQTIQLRWRRATDTTVAATGWRVDTISLAGGRTCCGSSTADLSITKTDGLASYVPGLPLTYTLVASSAGPGVAAGATVADTFPAAFTGINWTCSASAGSSCGAAAGAGNINALVTLVTGGAATFTATGTVSAAATGTLSNTATVAPPAGITDPVPGNNSATDSDTQGVATTADLAITKTDGVSFYYPGQTLTYTLTASNAGPSGVTGAPVTDSLPADLTGASWTCVASAGSACGAPSGAGNIASTVNLLSGGTATFTLTATASPTATGSIANTATLAAPGGTIDPTPGNNSATDTDARKGGSYHTVAPCRVLDTRDPAGPFGAPPLAASASRTFAVAGRCGIPSNATALSINLTVTSGTAAGFVVVSPTGGGVPPVSTINYSAGQTRANNAVVGLGAGGQVDLTCGQATGTVDAILDVSGYVVE